MANHPFQFFALNDQHTFNNNPMNQITQPSTNSRPVPNPDPNPTPNPTRGRTRTKTQKDKNRQVMRGPSIAELERQIKKEPETITDPSNIRPVSDCRVNPLPGVPVIGYYQPVSDPRWVTNRVGIPQSELPSMPNSPLQLQPVFKKMRLSDEQVGFAEGYNSHFYGIHMNIGNNHNNSLPNVGSRSEVLAIHPRRSNGSNMMMEYEFFPRNSEEIMKLKNHNYNPDMIEEQEQERERERLKLKMGFLDSSSPSPSSSLSSLTTNNSSNDFSLDLSLKL